MIFNKDKRFDLMLEKGDIGEQLLADVLGNKSIEVKTQRDALFNVNVEVYDLRSNRACGIATSTAYYWAFVLFNEKILFIKTSELRAICGRFSDALMEFGDDNCFLGFSIPVVELLNLKNNK